MLTLGTPYGFLMCFLMASVVSETTRSLRARGAFKGDVETGLFDSEQRVWKESLSVSVL